MPKATAAELKLESREVGKTMVYGPYERDYGRQHYGGIVKEGASFISHGTDGREIGRHRRKSDAVIAVVEWAEDNLVKESVERDFKPETAGGIPLRFLRRVVSAADISVVASFLDPERREWVTTSWDGDGICSVCRSDGSKESQSREDAMRLVFRTPEMELVHDGEEPDEGTAPRM